MSSPDPVAGSDSLRWQRARFLIALVLGVAVLTGTVLVLGKSLSERFTSQIQADLEWRALRGAQELSKTSTLALTGADPEPFNKALDAYAASPDIESIAIEIDGKIVSSRWTAEMIEPVFAAEPGSLVRGDGHVASWAEAASKGVQLGKVAVVVSTRQLTDAQAMQARVSRLTVISGIAAVVVGVLVILWFTRRTGSAAPLPEPVVVVEPPAAAAGPNLSDQVDELTDELDGRNRSIRAVLDHTVQGFLMVELSGRLGRDRSSLIDFWFGTPGAEATLAEYLTQHSPAVASQLARGLEAICEGALSLEECLAQMPKQLTADERTFDIKYAPVMQNERAERILLILSDITEQVARERAEREAREARELAVLSQLITGNRAEFDEFFAEIAGLISSLDAPSDAEAERRTVRTLKDNCAYYGLDTYVALCTQIEAAISEEAGAMSDAQRIALADGWGKIASQLARQLAAA